MVFGNTVTCLFITLNRDIDSNLKKIDHHGKCADGIVKGMLQHSQSRRGVKEPAGLNALIEEYARLAVHVAKAKDASFDMELKLHLDPNVRSVNVVCAEYREADISVER